MAHITRLSESLKSLPFLPDATQLMPVYYAAASTPFARARAARTARTRAEQSAKERGAVPDNFNPPQPIFQTLRSDSAW